MRSDEAREREEQIQERFEKVLRQRAERLGVPLDAAGAVENDTPLFRQAAEARAKLEGTSAEAILERYTQHLLESKYPTPDCLTPDDVLDYTESARLSDSQVAHLETCDACTALLGASRPSEAGLSHFAEEVRQMLARPGAPAVAESQHRNSEARAPAAAPRRAWGAFTTWAPAFSGAFAAVLLASVIVRTMVPPGPASPPSALLTRDDAAQKMVERFAALQAELAETKRMASQAEVAAREAQKAQASIVAKQEEATKTVLATLDEYKKLALSAHVASYLVWSNPSKKYQKGDIIFPTGSVGEPSPWQAFRVENPRVFNDVKGEVVRSIKEIGLQPTTPPKRPEGDK